jgi:hypothetical protein
VVGQAGGGAGPGRAGQAEREAGGGNEDQREKVKIISRVFLFLRAETMIASTMKMLTADDDDDDKKI